MIMSLAGLFPERGTDTTRRLYELMVVPEGYTPSLLENTSVTHHHNVDAAMTTDSIIVITVLFVTHGYVTKHL